jgi:hypothetical protein
MNKQLVLVEWADAWQDQENFSTAHGIASTHGPLIVNTLGWIIQDDEVGISVVNERSTADGHDTFRGRTFVPRAMIKKVTQFNLTKPRQAKPKVKSLETPKAPEEKS